VTLKIERRSSHPWIFQKMVEKPGTRIPPGSVVDVHDKNGQWVARGFYNGHSRISLRVLTSKPDEPVWILKCSNAVYRIRLRGNMAATVEVVNSYP